MLDVKYANGVTGVLKVWPQHPQGILRLEIGGIQQ